MNTDSPGEGIERRSLDEESRREASEYKWYLSEQHGYDVGESAIRAWVHDHWPGFLRARWIEHMMGSRFWIELDRSEYGLLKKEFGEYRDTLDEIVEMLKSGGENLNIICWARRTKSPAEQEKVRQILRLLKINDHRLRCKFNHENQVAS